jgi:hypothetical protein
MIPFKKSLSLALGLVVLATTAILISTAKLGAAPPPPSVPVTVVNTPLPVQGMVTAQISNTTLPVAGTVSVGNLPAVQAVSLSNTATTPLYVDADRSGRNGFGASCFTPAVDPTFGQASCTLATVPAGEEVVIETVSCSADVATGNIPQIQIIVPSPPLGGGAPLSLNHFLALNRQGGNSTIETWAYSSLLRAYAVSPSGGTTDIGVFFRTNPSAAVVENAICSISGYVIGQ